MPSRPSSASAEQDAEVLLDALEAAVPSLATRAADIAAGVFPEAVGWDELERRRFEHQAAERLEAIVRLTRQGESVRGAELDDLVEAGESAAAAGAPLPQLLLTLRVSRDLIIQAAVRAAGERGDGWSPALAIVLTKVLPVSDRLTDAVARGYWGHVLDQAPQGSADGVAHRRG